MLSDVTEVLSRAHGAGVGAVVNICTDKASLEAGLKLAEAQSPDGQPRIYNAASTTPHDVEKEGEEVFPLMAEAARSGRLVAVGETGLDYFYEHAPRELQKDFLRRYLHLAIEVALPVVIHCRDAFSDFFEILDAEYLIDGKLGPGVLHCFTGTAEEAEQVVSRGWYLSLSGIVSYKKSEDLRAVAKQVPLDQLLIETDAPYLAPQPMRGKRNEPSFLPETAKVIAEVKGISLEELAAATSRNARTLFRL